MPPSVPFDDADRERLVEVARLVGIGRLVPSVAHQLSTPLAAIALRAESLERAAERLAESEFLEKVLRYVKAIHEEAFRCKELLLTLQQFTRPPGGGDERVDLNVVCQGVSRLVHHEAMRRQVEVVTHLAEPMVLVTGDESQLSQVVLALVLNALAASPEKGVVRLETSVEQGQASVAVVDQGAGVPGSVVERLFEPFVSSHPPASGAGLGLMACAAIAARHKGRITWEHGTPGGTRFVVTLERGAGP